MQSVLKKSVLKKSVYFTEKSPPPDERRKCSGLGPTALSLDKAMEVTTSIRRYRSPKKQSHFGFALFLLQIILCLSANQITRVHGDLSDDIIGLTRLKQSLDRGNRLQWADNNTVCEWKGIQCSGTTELERVTGLRLPGMSLFGPIPEQSIGLLTELRVLSLRSNKISGSLPSDLSNCSFIRSLYLFDNEFSGALPSDFTVWPNLVHVDFSYNNFSGPMPSSLGNLTRLKTLFLQNNSLSGPIASVNTSSITNFSVAYNNLSGSIPETDVYRRASGNSFIGNNLCGFPLTPCNAETPSPSPSSSSSSSESTPSNANNTSSGSDRKKLSGGAIAGIVIAIIFLFLVLLFCCILVLRNKHPKKEKKPNIEQNPTQVASRSLEEPPYPLESVPKIDSATTSDPDRNRLVFFEGTRHVFDLEDLLRASAEVLGKGSVGTAYKAILESGSIVAVKRLKDVTIERKEFEQQMDHVGKLKHENLVPLIAYYYSKEEKLLVNEYMTNGSLSALLHGNKGANRTPLDWDTRVKIALGAALGIDYLHSQGFTHGNIKSSNILLTNNYNSCVSDYGLAQLVSTTPAASKVVGYRAPEVTDIRKVTTKADIYSFGVLLLELLTGKAPSTASVSEEGIDLPRWVQSVVKEEWTSEVFDVELLRFPGLEEDMVELLQIALSCVSPSPDQRPLMKQLLYMLNHLRKHDEEDKDIA